MESDEARQLLHDAERAEAAPWVDFPPTPAWYPPSVGVWAAALTAAIAMLDGGPRFAALAVLIVVELGFLRWYRSYRGALPTGLMPTEMRRPAALFGLGCLLVAGAAAVVVVVAGQPWLAVALVLVTVVPLVWWYERAYAAAAAATRARLG